MIRQGSVSLLVHKVHLKKEKETHEVMQKRETPSAMLFQPMDLIDIQDIESDNKSVTFKT